MPNRKIIKTSKFQKIVVEVAKKIAVGDYPVGSSIKGRSTLAATFGVSSETIRRAMNILADLHIVSLKQGVGVIILSKEKAIEFLDDFESTNDIETQKSRILGHIKNQEEQLKTLAGLVSVYLEQTKLVNKKYPLDPYGIRLSEDSEFIGSSFLMLKSGTKQVQQSLQSNEITNSYCRLVHTRLSKKRILFTLSEKSLVILV